MSDEPRFTSAEIAFHGELDDLLNRFPTVSAEAKAGALLGSAAAEAVKIDMSAGDFATLSYIAAMEARPCGDCEAAAQLDLPGTGEAP